VVGKALGGAALELRSCESTGGWKSSLGAVDLRRGVPLQDCRWMG